ncbi:MAG: DoxX family membrane protein [FCB group bacterium]|nr:DoxX family membrane protein [FCB group bacterium]
MGIMFVLHGYPKLFGGVATWADIGAKGVGSFGLELHYAFWGFLAAISEFGGGILLILGLFFRIALIFLLLTMVAAAGFHIITGQGSPYHAMEAGILFFSLLWIGPGEYSLDAKLFGGDL